MSTNEHIWVVILAGGNGTRVRDLTRDRSGKPAPKQYAAINGRLTLFESTLRRARKITAPERIVAIVAADHRRWWASELRDIPADNIIVQPENRGTAAGILLPLLRITQRDPDAVLVVLPSDHGVAVETTLHAAITDATLHVVRRGAGLIVLGVKPKAPERDYGWIVPAAGHSGPLLPVTTFREKPDPETAASLFAGGALLNSFILIADGGFLRNLFETTLPDLWFPFELIAGASMRGPENRQDLVALYRAIPSLDFSKDVLERATDLLLVYRVPGCGWVDLGTPDRLVRHVSDRAASPSTSRIPTTNQSLYHGLPASPDVERPPTRKVL